MQIFDGDEKELKARFSLSPMAVMWVGILRNKGVYLTEPLLELCALGGPLENFLKDRTLLSALGNPEAFSQLQKQHDPTGLFPLVLREEGTRRVLALEMETLAEQGWQKSHEPDALVQRGSQELTVPELRLPSIESLFSPEEVNRLKLTLATSVSSQEKIEAIRKISFAPVSAQEKLVLFLHMLGSEDADVRAEAAKALSPLGISREASDAMLALSSSEKAKRMHALSSVGQIFPNASEMEKGALLQILLAALSDSKYEACHIPIIRLMRKICGSIPKNAVWMMEKILSSALSILVGHLQEALEDVDLLFTELAEKDEALIASFLIKEIPKTENRRLRAFLLVLLAENTPHLAPAEMGMKMVSEVSLGDELDPVYLRLAAQIVAWGERVVDALLERFQVSIRMTEKLQMVALLEKIILEKKLSAQIKSTILSAYGRSFPTAPDALRSVVMDSVLLGDPEIEKEIKNALGREILVDIAKERLNQFSQAGKAALCRMQDAALPSLMDVIQKPLVPLQGIKATEILGDVVLSLPGDNTKTLSRLEAFCYDEIAKGKEHKPEIYKVLGKIAFAQCLTGTQAEEITDYLLEHLCTGGAPYAVLEALGWAASSAHTLPESKMNVIHLFMALMDRRLPEKIIREKKEGGSKIFECDVKTTAYTDLLPILIEGFKKIGISACTTLALRNSILQYLLHKWNQIVSYKILWGPKNTTDLAQTLTAFCLTSVTPQEKGQIAQALYQKIDIFSITEMITSVFFDTKDNALTSLAAQVASQLLSFWQSEEYTNAEDREVLMRCIGRMAASAQLDTTEESSQEMRTKLVYTLFDGLREQVFGVQEILANLFASPYLSENLRKDIENRLPPRVLSLSPIEEKKEKKS